MKTANTKSGCATDKNAQANTKTQQSNSRYDAKPAKRSEKESTMPYWVMHLLTGAGAIGGNYLLFIKPLQEKLTAMDKAIQQQEKTIEQLQEQVELLSHRLKKADSSGDDEVKVEPMAKEELFSLGNDSAELPLDLSKKRKVFRF